MKDKKRSGYSMGSGVRKGYMGGGSSYRMQKAEGGKAYKTSEVGDWLASHI